MTIRSSGAINEYDGSSGSSVTFTLTSAQVGDTVVLFQGTDYGPTAALPDITSAGVSWTRRTANTMTTQNRALSVGWTGVVTAAAPSVTVASGSRDACASACWYVLAGEYLFVGADTTNAQAAAATGAAPSVGSGQVGDRLFCGWQSEYQASGVWTPPGSMGTVVSGTASGAGGATAAHEAMTSAGATGTRTATQSASRPWCGTSVLMRAAATDVTVTDPTPAVTSVLPGAGESVEALDSNVTVAAAPPAPVGVVSPSGEAVSVEVPDPDPAAPVGVVSPAGESVEVSVDDPTPAATSVLPGVGESVFAEEPGLPAGGAPHVTVWAVDRVSGELIRLPHALQVDLSPIRNAPGSFRVEYPAHGRNADVLRAPVDERRRVTLEFWVGGSRFNAMRGDVVDFDGDDVAEDSTYTVTGHFLEWRLGFAVLMPDPSDEKGETRFSAAKPGAIVAELMAAAQARGTLTYLDTSSFSATHDSNGVPWPADTSVTIKLSPKVTYLQILTKLVDLGVLEWEVTLDNQLRLYAPGGLGRDLTVLPVPVMLRRGRDLLESSRRASLAEVATDMNASGAEGLYASAFDATARALHGEQIERFVDANNITDPGALSAYVQKALAVAKSGVMELAFGLVFGTNRPAPVAGFKIGDWVFSDITGDSYERVRVVQWTLSQDAGGVSGSVTLNDLIADRVTRLLRRLNALEGGEAAAGTSEPPPDLTGDTMPPAAPTGLVCSSEFFTAPLDPLGLGYAAVTASWSAVTTNADATPTSDVVGYQVRWRLAVTSTAEPGIWNPVSEVGGTTAQFTTGAGEMIQVQVAAVDRARNRSEWSSTVELTTETDQTAPPTPSTPTAAPYLGQVKVGYDGLGSAGEPMPPDTDKIELELSESAGFEPELTRVVDEFSPNIAGERVITGLAYGVAVFVRLIARDRTGNRSAPSASASALPARLVNIDLGPDAVQRANIVAAAIGSAEIDSLAVNDAHVADLSAGKLTAGTLTAAVTNSGIIRSGTSGQRYELDAASLRFYDAGGTQTVQLNGTANWIMGEIRTALTGARFVLNPGGIAPDEMRFYPTSGGNYGRLNTVTSMSVDFGPQSGISMKAHSGRSDNFSGQVQCFPDYASMSWGESSIQTVPQQITIGAPRLHLAAFRNSSHAVGTAEVIRMGVVDRNNPPDFIPATTLAYQCSSGDEPSFRSLWWNSGLAFGNTFTGSINNASSAYIPHRASAFQVFTSARATKRDIADLDYEGGPLAAVRRAKVQRWRRIGEVEQAGDAAAIHIGPMVDDLPSEIVRTDQGSGQQGYELDSLLGLVHAAVTQLADQVDGLSARLDTLDRPAPGQGGSA